jgi:hypothetical protein
MFKKIVLAMVCITLIAAIAAGCAKKAAELPEPSVLYSAVQSAAGLSDMIELSPAELLDLTGIADNQYSLCAAYRTGLGMLPDEVIIIRAVDADDALDVESKLKDRVEYKRKSAMVYLTENLPTIEAGVVRRDGLTVTLIVAEGIEAAIEAYENAK